MVVMYNTKSHLTILTQMYGSIWKKILPFCIANVVLVYILTILYEKYEYKFLGITNYGHSLITSIVSFVLVTRVNQALSRYNEGRQYLESISKETRDLITTVCIYTKTLQSNCDQEWRYEISYRSLLLLRTINIMIDYNPYNNHRNSTTATVLEDTIPELNGIELNEIKESINSSSSSSPINVGDATNTKNNSIQKNNNNDASSSIIMRIPILVSYLLRDSIETHNVRLSKPLIIGIELKLVQTIDNLMTSYYGLRKFTSTPVPFPLVQMARTFLFLFVYTVPFVIITDSSGLFIHCISIFIFTYGFIGLECVAIELDDPFGDDTNDFDNNYIAELANEDIYLRIFKLDGLEWADKLRQRMNSNNKKYGNEVGSTTSTGTTQIRKKSH